MLIKVLFAFAVFNQGSKRHNKSNSVPHIWRGLIIDVFLCLQADGHITGVGRGVRVGRAYKWQFTVFALRLPIVHKIFFTFIHFSLYLAFVKY